MPSFYSVGMGCLSAQIPMIDDWWRLINGGMKLSLVLFDTFRLAKTTCVYDSGQQNKQSRER